MPPRLITGAILAFWLAMTGLLIHREVVPMMLADAAPTYQPDLTDEIGSHTVVWKVFHDGKRIGSGTSGVVANIDDRTYEFGSSFHFSEFRLGPANVYSMESMYRVTEEGKLLAFSTKSEVGFGDMSTLKVGIEGDVVNGVCVPRVLLNNTIHPLDQIDLPQQGSIVNPMHLVNRLRKLRVGQTWRITMVDPLRGVTNKFMGDFGKGMTISALIAEVKTDTLKWDRKEVLCYTIEYREPGKEISARTWVRKSDGLVLQQEANHLGFDMVLKRVPT